MSPAEWGALALVCLAGAISPGPSLALVLRHASVSRTEGLRCAVAHGAGIAGYALLAVTGLGLLLTARPWILELIALLGALWLLRLAVRLWRSPRRLEAATGEAGRPGLDGLAMALLNPKILVFFTAIFSQFLPAGATLAEQLGMAAMAGLIDGLWYAAVTLVWRRLGLGQALRRINQASAVIFASVAAGLLVNGVLRWLPAAF